MAFGDVAGLDRCARFAADVTRDDNAAVSAVLVQGFKGDDDVAWSMDNNVPLEYLVVHADDTNQESATGAQLCAAAAGAGLVVVCAPAGGLVQELLYGPALGHVLRHCDRPVVLLNNTAA